MWFFSKFKTCLNLNLSLGLSRAEDGACTIEAAAAKVAVPQAQALQTPAAFSPTPESTEFDPFCSLRPQLICPGLHTQPSLARRGPWDLVPEPWRKTFPHPSVSHPLFCAIMFNASSLVLCALQNQAVTSCTGERNDYEPRVKFSDPLLFTKLCLTFLIRLSTISSTDRVVTWKIVYQARALRALGLLLADGTPTVGGGKTFWRVSQIFLRKQL